MAETDIVFPPFLERIVNFPDIGTSFELLEPVNNLRKCHDGTPQESRIVIKCRKASPDSVERHETFVMKIKVQVSDDSPESREPAPGPSTTTTAELEALRKFTAAKLASVPHLMAWKQTVQGNDGPLPGGFINFTVMNMLPGSSLFDLKILSLPNDERARIAEQFLPALRPIYALGVEPIDRGLRNVLWDRESQACSIIDFELWQPNPSNILENEKRELERWGIVEAPMPKGWFEAWAQQWR